MEQSNGWEGPCKALDWECSQLSRMNAFYRRESIKLLRHISPATHRVQINVKFSSIGRDVAWDADDQTQFS